MDRFAGRTAGEVGVGAERRLAEELEGSKSTYGMRVSERQRTNRHGLRGQYVAWPANAMSVMSVHQHIGVERRYCRWRPTA